MKFLYEGFKSYSLTGIYTERWMDRQTDRQTDGQTDRHTHMTENITYPHTRVVIKHTSYTWRIPELTLLAFLTSFKETIVNNH